MQDSSSAVSIWRNPKPTDIPADFETFLESLGGPTWITLDGEDASRNRALVTLSHGNEPSGARAIHRWLKEGKQPKVNCSLCIASVEAALREPRFTHRFSPDKQDLNRCFRPPFEGEQGHIAKAILDFIEETKPESVIDVHNTSGQGESFGITTKLDESHIALVTLFTQKLIMTHLNLGSLMEVADETTPIITAECGGSGNPLSDQIAWMGLTNYLMTDNVLIPHDNSDIEILYEPIRFELEEEIVISYGLGPEDGVHLVLPHEIDQQNFQIFSHQEPIGWLGENNLEGMMARTSHGTNVIDEMFFAENNLLYPKVSLKLFMITRDPKIAKDDCVFYAVKA